MVDVTKENHIGWRNPGPCASPPTVSIGPVYDLKMPPFVSLADHQSIRQAALLEGVRIGMAFAVKNILSDGMALAALYGTDPAVVLARHGAKPAPTQPAPPDRAP